MILISITHYLGRIELAGRGKEKRRARKWII